MRLADKAAKADPFRTIRRRRCVLGSPTSVTQTSKGWQEAGVTEVGFELGGGGQLLIGDPYGSKVALGFESINAFGTRIWSRVDITATQRVTVSPIIEVTNLPHADDYGVRLLLELTADLGGGFDVTANGGYQARQATSGGPGGALRLSYSF